MDSVPSPPRGRRGLPPWMARKKSRQPKLLLVEGQATRQEMAIRLPLSIGREPGQGLVISHPLVSRHHCTLTHRDSSLWVKDLNSSNGTLINGERVLEAALHPGDKLTVGPLTFVAVYQPDDLRSTVHQRAEEVIREAREDVMRDRETPEFVDTLAGLTTIQTDNNNNETEPSSGDDEKIGLFLSWAQQMAQGRRRSSEDEAPAPAKSETQAKAEVKPKPAKKSRPAQQPRPAAHSSDDVASLVESDRASQATQPTEALSQTLVAKDLSDPALRPQAPVAVEPEITEAEQPSDAEPSPPVEEPSDTPPRALTADQKAVGQLVGEIGRFQARVFDHYQQMALTMRLVSRLQQDQLDLLRDEIERLCQLNDLLRERLVGRYRIGNGTPEAQAAWNAAEQAERQANESLEQLHTELLRTTTGMQTSARDHWRNVRRALKDAGFE